MKKKIAVFCGSSPVQSIKIKKDVKILCEFLVKNKISIIYGGGEEGLMGYLANLIASLNGSIKGVITNQLLILPFRDNINLSKYLIHPSSPPP